MDIGMRPPHRLVMGVGVVFGFMARRVYARNRATSTCRDPRVGAFFGLACRTGWNESGASPVR